jgi:hypothetical protein
MALKEQEIKIPAKEDFAEWACEYSGFDGGNLETGSIWFCGIEYGDGEHWTEERLKSEFEKGAKEIEHVAYGEDFLNAPFNAKLLKLYSSILGRSTTEFRVVFKKTSTFDRTSDT